MRASDFKILLLQVLKEYQENKTCFYVPVLKMDKDESSIPFLGQELESPIGPSAGPHTQMAQNIVASYAAGARFFELKTVEVKKNDENIIKKPSIYMKDESYSIEAPPEFSIEEAMDEYVKAWILIKVLSKEWEIGNPDKFVFNMNIGYDLESIQSRRMNHFIEGMQNASNLPIWKECKTILHEQEALFENIDSDYIESITPEICFGVTFSPLYSISANEVEDCIAYLLHEKKINTYLKCNSLVLGYDTVRTILDNMGYQEVEFSKEQFDNSIKYTDMLQTIGRLKEKSQKEGVVFGIKLTNSFPVNVKDDEFEKDVMYMSGKALYPLAIRTAKMFGEAFQGQLPMSFSGGVDRFNISEIYRTGIYPITVTTILLKQGGYTNLTKLWTHIKDTRPKKFNQIDTEALNFLAKDVISDTRYYRLSPNEKKMVFSQGAALDCHLCSNCVDTCPNRANIPLDEGEVRHAVHFDALCSGCGNCTCACPVGFKPHLDKFTIFSTEEDFYNSNNSGAYLSKEKEITRLGGEIKIGKIEEMPFIPKEVIELIRNIKKSYQIL